MNNPIKQGAALGTNAVYPSIFRDEGWTFGRFLGWRPVLFVEGLQVWRRELGPLQRYQVLLDDLSQLHDARLAPIWTPRSQVIVKVFGSPCADAAAHATASGKTVALASESERLFNKFTFALDLTQDEDTLWARFNQTTRKQCRIALERGVDVTAVGNPAHESVAHFLAMLADMSHKRNLAMPDGAMIHRMMAAGAARLHCSALNGDALSYALVYRVDGKIYYLHGVSADADRGVGGGQLLHWDIIKSYRAMGVRWYDLGGVPEVNNSNGIYSFKRGFGGQLVDLGPEYVWTGRVFKWALGARARLQAMRGGRK